MDHPPLRFGVFLAPFHPVREDPTGTLDRDLALVELLDRLRFDEAWIGEHHSAGYETISSPEIFIGIAAERTRRIRLGTGVVSLPYHHPFMVAERMVQLDHMTRGRCMLGVGPGSLQSDARMLGLEPTMQRAMYSPQSRTCYLRKLITSIHQPRHYRTLMPASYRLTAMSSRGYRP